MVGGGQAVPRGSPQPSAGVRQTLSLTAPGPSHLLLVRDPTWAGFELTAAALVRFEGHDTLIAC